jgi:hypothetical protein
MTPVDQIAAAFALVKEILGSVGEGRGVLSQVRGRGAKEKASHAFGRLLYAEVLLNVVTLTMGQTLAPAQLVFARRTWDALQHSPADIYLQLEPKVVTVVAAAYLHLEVTAHLFGQDPFTLIGARLRGHDQVAMEQVAESFRAAERALRPVAFTPEEAAHLFGQLDDAGLFSPPGKHGLLSRASGVMTSLPSWFVLGGTGLLMARNLRALRQDWQRRRS